MIQKQLVDKLALSILEGEFGEGDTVRVDAAEGELAFAGDAASTFRTVTACLDRLNSAVKNRELV